ncbi:MAG TPA: T9SS type A sorting domain-containing protein [Bacteroidia bacterium]|jgi:PKD repeat protein
MKKHLLFASLFLTMGMSAFAQGASPRQFSLATDTPTRVKPAASMDRNITCGPDTALYTYLKEVELYSTPSPVFYTTYYLQNEGMSQGFTLSAPATITGIDFYGKVKDFPNPAQTITAVVSLFSVDATYKPLAPLATGTCVMTTTGAFRQVIFTTPVSITSNFAVVVTNPSLTDTMQIYTNNAAAATYGEGLGYLTWGGVWYQNLDPVNGFAQDLEGLISPIISHSIATNYTMSPAATTMCLGTALTFTNTTTPTAILSNRMFNYGSFNGFWNSVPDSVYAWDMGNGSPLQWSTNAAYTYPASGLDTVTLYTLGGLFTSCLDAKETYLNVQANAVASFTQNTSGSPLIAFTSTSTGATTYSWDFGDGSAADITANPSHTYAPGIYTVVLTITGPCNTTTSSQTVTILSTDINASVAAAGLSVYPNPSNGLFTVELNAAQKASIQVYNVVGKLVYSAEASSAKNNIDLSTLAPGVYSLRVISENSSAVKQITITK